MYKLELFKMPSYSKRHKAMSFGLLGGFILSLSLVYSGASAFEVTGWGAEYDSDYMSISLGPSYSSVGIIQLGARRIPYDGQSFTIMGSDESAHHTQHDPSLSSALFDYSHMVCDATEPEYFLHRAMKRQISRVDLSANSHEAHVFKDAVIEALQKLKKTAETWTLGPIEQAVVTVPQYFTTEERITITEAAYSIGLEVLRIMNAPIAAAIGFGIDKLDDEFHFIVYDLGRETFEVSLFEFDAGVFGCLASISDNQLGREVSELMQKKRLRGSSEFDATEMEILEKTLPLLDQVIKRANLSSNDISKVVIVGGYTGAPQLRSMVEIMFGTGTSAISDYPGSLRSIPGLGDYDEIVTFGTAVFAENLCGRGVYGDLVGTLELNPRSILIETIGGEALRVLNRYTVLPFTRTMNITTTVDGQSRVVIPVFQGELEDARKNDKVLVLRLECIPPAPRGTHTIEVALEAGVDTANDAYRFLLKASAYLKGGREQCSDNASGVLHDFGAVDALTGEDIELEAAYVYGRAEPTKSGTCINSRSEVDQHYVAAAGEVS